MPHAERESAPRAGGPRRPWHAPCAQCAQRAHRYAQRTPRSLSLARARARTQYAQRAHSARSAHHALSYARTHAHSMRSARTACTPRTRAFSGSTARERERDRCVCVRERERQTDRDARIPCARRARGAGAVCQAAPSGAPGGPHGAAPTLHAPCAHGVRCVCACVCVFLSLRERTLPAPCAQRALPGPLTLSARPAG